MLGFSLPPTPPHPPPPPPPPHFPHQDCYIRELEEHLSVLEQCRGSDGRLPGGGVEERCAALQTQVNEMEVRYLGYCAY